MVKVGGEGKKDEEKRVKVNVDIFLERVRWSILQIKTYRGQKRIKIIYKTFALEGVVIAWDTVCVCLWVCASAIVTINIVEFRETKDRDK